MRFLKCKDSDLTRQQQNPSIRVATGVGGLGEVEFIKNIQFYDGYFVLHHGITTFLRLGDVSLVDLKKREIVAVGEIKSKKVAVNEIQITLLLSGPEFSRHANLGKTREISGISQVNLPREIMRKLEIQMRRIRESFSQAKQPDKESSRYMERTHFEELGSLCRKVKTHRATCQRAGDGLVLIGLKFRKSKLSSRVMLDPKVASTLQGKLAGVETAIIETMGPERADNRLILQPLHYTSDSPGSHTLPGMTPLFWWPLDIDSLKGIIFRQVSVETVFNPAHLAQKLRNAGFEVRFDPNNGRQMKVTRQLSETKTISIEKFSYFVWLIQQYLFAEDEIVSILGQLVLEIEQGVYPENSRIDLLIQQRI